jgi:glucosylceramidase
MDKGQTTMVRRIVLLGLIVVLLRASSLPVFGQDVQVCVSAKSGERMAPGSPLRFEPSRPKDVPSFRIDDSVTFQKIDGFGASFLEAGMICLNSLPSDRQEGVLRMLFDPKTGAGFSAMKTVIAATDFMSAGPFYTYDDTAGDVELQHFSIQRDLGPNGLITYIKRARKYGHFMLQAPMDYAPDWMLTTVQDKEHQDVDPKYYDVLAHYYLRYLREYEKQGVFIDYLSLFNEPGIYTKIRYEEIRDLLKNHVGPLFAREGVKTRIQLSEAPERGEASKSYATVLDDPEARKYVACLPYHGYGWKDFDGIAELHRRYPDLPLWMTEICYAYDSGTPPSMPLPRYDFLDGDWWGNEIVSDLEAGASAWIYWNMILDQNGGPWLVSEVHEDGPENIQHPVIIIDRYRRKVTYTGLYYYLAHFSKFVRPGSVRIETTGSAEHVRCISFKSPDGGLVAQVLNSQHHPATVLLAWHGRVLRLSLLPLSITTCLWK